MPPSYRLTLVALCCCAAFTGAAAEPDAVAPGKAGFVIGDFTVVPSITAGITYSDNLRQDPSNEGDWRADAVFAVNVASSWKEHELTFDASHTERRYRRVTSQDNSLNSAGGSGRYDLNERWKIITNLRYFENEVSRSNPNGIPGALQATVGTSLFNLQANYEGERVFDWVILNAQHLTFGSAFRAGQEIAQNNQNRTEVDFANLLGFKFDLWKLKPYLYVSRGTVDYDSTSDRTLGLRSSVDYKYGGGAAMEPIAGLSVEFRLGGISQAYDDPTIGTLKGWFGSAGAVWRIDDKTTAILDTSRTFSETNIPGSPGYFMSQGTLTLQRKLDERLTADLAHRSAHYNVVQYPLHATNLTTIVGLSYAITPLITARIQMLHQHQRGNQPLYTFFENAETAQISLRF
ncbi:MAG: hypothetical protein JWM77_1552 [Rhodospirillales bacterium]|nr:hypothetical protein [Rhodospirillales bacterium]